MKRLLIYTLLVCLVAYGIFWLNRQAQNARQLRYKNQDIFSEIRSELQDFLRNHYLYNSSNLHQYYSRVVIDKVLRIKISLNEKAIYNPNDSKSFFLDFCRFYERLIEDKAPDADEILKFPEISFTIYPYTQFGNIFWIHGSQFVDEYKEVSKKINSEKDRLKKVAEYKDKALRERKEKVRTAYDNLYFGDSEATVMKKLDYPHYKTFKYIDIGGYTFTLTPLYHNNQLYKVRISSKERTANYFDTDVRFYQNFLIELIKKQYGNPDNSYIIGYFDLNSDYISWSDIWYYDTKTIKIGLLESDYQYSAVMWIYDQSIQDEIDKQKNAEATRSRNEAVKKF